MESADDDAGAAASASRPVAAREMRDGESAATAVARPSDTAIADGMPPADIPAITDDCFDGDSVPSPSAQDINTSTEAILDMIDEIVDGPGAPKRLPLLTNTHPDLDLDVVLDFEQPASVDTFSAPDRNACASDDFSNLVKNFNVSSKDENLSHSSEPSATSAKSDNLLNANISLPSVIRTDLTLSQESTSALSINEVNVESPQASSSVLQTNEEPVSELNVSSHLFVSEAQSEYSIPNVPSSSEELREENSLSSECHSSERTVPCIESSDQVKKVVIESAESTSDNSDSVENVTIREKSKFSPLRRRLVRPAPIDRRPDTTVSSTVDSQTNVHTVDRVIGDSLTKDVSSSSDAISSRLSSENKQNQENREVSICKAETSVSPSKRIKLIRHKNVPQLTPGDIKIKDVTESQVCQSTSSEVPSPSLIELVSGNPLLNSISAMESTSEDSRFDSHIDCNKAESTKWNVTESHNENTDSKESIPLLVANLEPEESNCENKNDKCVSKELSQIDLSMPSSSKINEIEQLKSSETLIKHCESEIIQEQIETKVPKLTIKLNKSLEEVKSLPKLTIKASKICDDFIPNVTKINIKPIPRPPEKFNEVHRKSSSSDVSESESSENDDSASTSDQTSTSDQGPTDIVPKVTIKLGKPGTDAEGQFYTEKNVPKLTIIKHLSPDNEEDDSKIKLMVCQPEDIQSDKIPKLTIKPMSRNLDSQPLSPKLTIKSIKPQERSNDLVESQQVPKLKITHELVSPICDLKESVQVPKITIKSVAKTEETMAKLKKINIKTDSPEHIPIVTKLNIKPIVKPLENNESTSDVLEESEEKVPVVSKINIKPIIKPKDICKDSRLDSIPEEIPRVTKINIKPLKEPDTELLKSQENKDWHIQNEEKNIPVITKINIKPLIKPSAEESKEKDLSVNVTPVNESIPVVSKLTIKPLIKPSDIQDDTPARGKTPDADAIPVVTKLNIKPILKPDETPSSPKKEKMETKNVEIPIITKLNIKPIVKPEDHDLLIKSHKNRDEETPTKHPPLVMKINIKAMSENSTVEHVQATEHVPKENNLDHSQCNNIKDDELTPSNLVELLSKNEEGVTKIVTENKIEKEEQSLNVNFQESTTSLKNNDLEINCKGSEIDQNLVCVSSNCVPEGEDNLIIPEKGQKVIQQDMTIDPNSIDKCIEDKKDNSTRSKKLLEQQENFSARKDDEPIENRSISPEFKIGKKGLEVNTEIPPLERAETQIQITSNLEKDKKIDHLEGPKLEQNFQLLKRLLERDKDRADSMQNTSVEHKISESASTLDKLLASDSDKVTKRNFVDSICDDNAVSEVIENTTMCSITQTLKKDGKSEADIKTNRIKFQDTAMKDFKNLTRTRTRRSAKITRLNRSVKRLIV
ncbi:hypothetical protein EVAR_53895_1 [Eumeta japonica]|uniref:Uncharacterized protein n=1 Tax=Eumeta variegata TaxID=151549 RepID=A0A4C1YG92_EUMVA|nr:hypothetical protein EVAR_53895_1 [Eumeta japonica]